MDESILRKCYAYRMDGGEWVEALLLHRVGGIEFANILMATMFFEFAQHLLQYILMHQG